MEFCQSCSMPLTNPGDAGTEKDGGRSGEYCKYCYRDGAFTVDCTMEQMIDQSAPIMAGHNPGTTEEQAKAQMREFFPKLKRWAAR